MSTQLIEEQLRRILKVLKERLPDPKTGKVTEYHDSITQSAEEIYQDLLAAERLRGSPYYGVPFHTAPAMCEEMLDSWGTGRGKTIFDDHPDCDPLEAYQREIEAREDRHIDGFLSKRAIMDFEDCIEFDLDCHNAFKYGERNGTTD